MNEMHTKNICSLHLNNMQMRYLAVVAERRSATGSLTEEAGTAGATGGQHNEAAVGSGTPARIGIGGQHAAQHEILVFLQQRFIVQYRPDI